MPNRNGRTARIEAADNDDPLKDAKNAARTTIFLNEELNENLEALALTTGDAKGVIVRKALAAYMKSHGLQPDKKPKITVSY